MLFPGWQQAVGALLVTQLASCFAAMTWGLLSYREDGRVQITHIASGALCGLAGITPGSGFVLPIAGLPIGILSGLAGWYGGHDGRVRLPGSRVSR